MKEKTESLNGKGGIGRSKEGVKDKNVENSV